jgi:hypothetical protein
MHMLYLILLTTVVTQTEQCCTTGMPHYKSCKSCLHWNYFPSVKAFFFYLISGPSLMDIAYDKYNYANLYDLQNIRNNVQ